MRWFRMYDMIMDSPEVRTMSPAAQLDYVWLLCLANRHRAKTGDNDGNTGATVKECAFRSRSNTFTQSLDEMIAAELATVVEDSQHVVVLKWGKYQAESDDAAARMREYRRRQKKNAGPGKQHDDRHAFRTRDVTRSILDIEGEEEPSTSLRSVEGSARDGVGALDTFEPLPAPSPDHVRLAATLRVDAQYEHAKFVDHCIANGKTFKDYDAAFRNWMKRAREFGTKNDNGKAFKATALDVGKKIDAELQRDIDSNSAR